MSWDGRYANFYDEHLDDIEEEFECYITEGGQQYESEGEEFGECGDHGY